jgi:DNA-binding NtrC family response regulator
MRIRALVAEEDLNLHQVTHDILEMCFSDVKIERAMNYESLMAKLRAEDADYDLVLYDLKFDELSGSDALPTIRKEMPELANRIIVLAGNGDDVRRSAHARDLAYVLHPFSLDDFIDTVKRVRERAVKDADETEDAEHIGEQDER